MKKARDLGQDYGNIVPFKCTICESSGHNLVKLKSSGGLSAAYMLVRILLSQERKNWIFYCESCGLKTDIPDDEGELLASFGEKLERVENEELSVEQYLSDLMSCESTVVKEMYARSKSWDCPTCHIDVPATFETCWECGTECPNPEVLILFEGNVDLNTNALFGSSVNIKSDRKEK